MDITPIYTALSDQFCQEFADEFFLAEQKAMDSLLSLCRGRYGVQLGSLGDYNGLAKSFHQRNFIVADKPYPHVNLTADLKSLPFENESVDTVFLLHVLEICSSGPALMQEVARILRPGGYVILWTFNALSSFGFYRYLQRLGSRHRALPWSLKFYTHHHMNHMLNEAGLRLLVSYKNFYCPPLVSMKTMAKWHFLEKVGETIAPGLGASAVYCATKQTPALTPICLKWNRVKHRANPSPVVSAQG